MVAVLVLMKAIYYLCLFVYKYVRGNTTGWIDKAVLMLACNKMCEKTNWLALMHVSINRATLMLAWN